MKREVGYHEVVVRFIVSHRHAKVAVSQFPQLRGKRAGTAVQKLAEVIEAGIGGNDMGALDVEQLEIEIDRKRH